MSTAAHISRVKTQLCQRHVRTAHLSQLWFLKLQQALEQQKHYHNEIKKHLTAKLLTVVIPTFKRSYHTWHISVTAATCCASSFDCKPCNSCWALLTASHNISTLTNSSAVNKCISMCYRLCKIHPAMCSWRKYGRTQKCSKINTHSNATMV